VAPAHDELDGLALIRPEERDYNLKLQETPWGKQLGQAWRPHAKPAWHFSREIPVHGTGSEATKLREHIVPFPSAPIYGINRKAEYGMSLAERPNMHTLRVLTRPRSKPIKRLFILHNGLNETETLRFYYRLTDWLLAQQQAVAPQEGAACLIMPFPGHLMHSSFHGPFTETPLSRYLNDAGELFRQFLRHMVGMRWLLSIVADAHAVTKPWMVGGDLLDPAKRKDELHVEAEKLHERSETRLNRFNEKLKRATGPAPETIDIGTLTEPDQITATEQLLRDILQRDSSRTPESLRIHVVGYSLGGFLAQSVFFAWPQVVSSCTTICSGGALNALSPTAFAQPEEWQSVLHALGPELSNSMLQGRLGDDERQNDNPVENVAGMPLQRFGYFQRIFEQVFLQEDHSSYKERLSEYGLRMLFVSGGEDPIVPPKNVLDASPKEGTTMLSIAGMTHFLNQEPRKERSREIEQREFWLPEAGGLIARAAIHSEKVHDDERALALEYRTPSGTPERDDAPRPVGSPLLSNSETFESALDWVLGAVDARDGWLLISRNTLPAAFIGSHDFDRWGAALHHHDVRIQQYVASLRRHAKRLKIDRTTLILPAQLQHWFVDLSARFDAHSDGPAGRMTTALDRKRIWRKFEATWSQSIRRFEGGNIGSLLDPDESFKDAAENFAETVARWQEVSGSYLEVTHLPDVWVGIQAGGKLVPARSATRGAVHQELLEEVTRVLDDEIKKAADPRLKLEELEDLRRLVEDIESGHIRIVQVSAAEFNPRYRGKVERSPKTVTRLLAACAAGLIRSAQIEKPAPARRSTGARRSAVRAGRS
jgi:pimeloyl-ACP methyl ester carboxylesterase